MNNTGVILDPRTEEEKAKDYSHEEVTLPGASSVVTWVEKPKESWKFFSKRNQHYSLSCMAQSGAKVLGVENVLEEGTFIDFSALDIYDRRTNKPGGGMWGQNLMNVLAENGACLETQLPSQGFTEAQMNVPVTRTPDMVSIATKYRAGGYLEIKNRTIDEVASIIAQGKAVELIVFFDINGAEWWRNVPEIIYKDLKNGAEATRHGIAAVDFTLWNGKKALIIEDSAGNSSSIDGKGQRVLTEDMFNARCYYAAYVIERKNEEGVIPKPVYSFNKNLSFGMRNDKDVAALQDILKYEGLFNLEVPSTGNYLEQTAQAVLKWQIKHGVAPLQELNSLKGKSFGPKSRAVANPIYKKQ